MNYLVILRLTVIVCSIFDDISAEEFKTNKVLNSKDVSDVGHFKADHFKDFPDDSSSGNNRDSLDMTQSIYYNPVLQNDSELFDYLNLLKRSGTHGIFNHSKPRRKRSTMMSRRDLSEQSLCPWTMDWNEDPQRIPQHISYAKCKTTECNFSFAKLDFPASFQLKIETVCETVKTDEISAYKDGGIIFLQNWPIACACAKAYTHEPSSKIFSSSRENYQHGMVSNTTAVKFENNIDGSDDQEIPLALGEQLRRQDLMKKQNSVTFEEVMKQQEERLKMHSKTRRIAWDKLTKMYQKASAKPRHTNRIE